MTAIDWERISDEAMSLLNGLAETIQDTYPTVTTRIGQNQSAAYARFCYVVVGWPGDEHDCLVFGIRLRDRGWISVEAEIVGEETGSIYFERTKLALANPQAALPTVREQVDALRTHATAAMSKTGLTVV